MSDGGRRTEILDTAASLFASHGLDTSLKDVADACGILPGSLYHHFESKEAIFSELVQRYRDDLERVATEADDTAGHGQASAVDVRVVSFGRAVAACAVRHRAGLYLTMHELPPGVEPGLTSFADGAPSSVRTGMLEILESGRDAGAVRGDVDLDLLAERVCQSMLHFAVGDSYLAPGAAAEPELRCRILLDGLAAVPPAPGELDRSDALSRARAVVTAPVEGAGDTREESIRLAAKTEFGRRGYAATGMREVAAVAGVASSAVYRHYESKEALLEAVMRPYAEERFAAWGAVLGSSSSPRQKLDALSWVNIVLLDRFRDEFRIQSAWLREWPPNIRKLGSTAGQRRDLRALLASGERNGELRLPPGNMEQRGRGAYEALWTPESIVRSAGPARSHQLARQTVLEGALVR
jgi:AcrR family transcriptional regulator